MLEVVLTKCCRDAQKTLVITTVLAIGWTCPEPSSFSVGTQECLVIFAIQSTNVGLEEIVGKNPYIMALHPMTPFASSGPVVAFVSSTDLFIPCIKQIERGFVWQSYFSCHGPLLKVKHIHFLWIISISKKTQASAILSYGFTRFYSIVHPSPSFSARLHGFSDLASTLEFTCALWQWRGPRRVRVSSKSGLELCPKVVYSMKIAGKIVGNCRMFYLLLDGYSFCFWPDQLCSVEISQVPFDFSCFGVFSMIPFTPSPFIL